MQANQSFFSYFSGDEQQRGQILEREIGRGSQGQVYVSSYNYQQVAIKKSNKAPDINILNLYHPNLVRIFDTYQEGCDFMTVMELGEPIRNFECFRNRPDVVLALAMDILSALAYLHANGIAHRDIKPDNIIVVMRDTKKCFALCDFDLSIAFNEPYVDVLSTVAFQSPESIQEGSKDARKDLNDIFSLGVTLYYLVTNRHLRPELNYLQLCYFIGAEYLKNKNYRIEFQLNGDTKEHQLLEDIIRLCLLPRTQRPSAQDLLTKLLPYKIKLN